MVGDDVGEIRGDLDGVRVEYGLWLGLPGWTSGWLGMVEERMQRRR